MRQIAIVCGVLVSVFLVGSIGINVVNNLWHERSSVELPNTESPRAARQGRRSSEHPVPAWIEPEKPAYLRVFLGFKIDRDDVKDWPLPTSSLRCTNTQFCVYGVDDCARLTVASTDGEEIRFRSPAGPTVTVIGPWALLFQTESGCRAKAGDKYLAVESRWETYRLSE